MAPFPASYWLLNTSIIISVSSHVRTSFIEETGSPSRTKTSERLIFYAPPPTFRRQATFFWQRISGHPTLISPHGEYVYSPKPNFGLVWCTTFFFPRLFENPPNSKNQSILDSTSLVISSWLLGTPAYPTTRLMSTMKTKSTPVSRYTRFFENGIRYPLPMLHSS